MHVIVHDWSSDVFTFHRCFRSLTEKFEEGLLFREEGLAFVSRVTDLLELLLEYRYLIKMMS